MFDFPRGIRARQWIAALAIAAFAACGGSDGDPTVPQGDFTFAIAPTALTLQQGQSGQVTATLTRTGGFAGAITGTVEGVPAGVTLTPLAIAAGSTSAQVTVSAAATAAPGTYPITVRASGTGVSQKTTTVTLTVTAAPAPTLAVAMNPTALTLAPGAQGTAQATITRGGGFAGEVALTVTGAPAGMTVTAPAIPAAATASTVTIAVGAAVAPGVHTLNVRATGTGVAEATTTLAVTVTAAADYAVELAPAALTIAPGAQGTSAINITRTGGFAGALGFALQGNPPAGMIITLPTNAVAGATAAITVAVGAQVAPGTYPLSINVTGTGVPARTVTLTVTVPSLGNVTLAANPANVTVIRGQTVQTTITVTRTAPLAAPVTLAVAGLPNGVTAAVDPNPVAGTTATVTFTAAANATVGAGTATITGTGGGVTSAPLSVGITVQANGSGGGGNVTYTFCSASGLPLFVAWQDGNGPWVRATAGVNNTYTFNIASGRGGVATVLPETGGSSGLDITYGTVAELDAMGQEECEGQNAGGRSFTGTVAGATPMDFVSIIAGNAFAQTAPGGSSYLLEDVRSGPFDLFATRYNFMSGARKFIIRRNIDPPNNSALPVLDFNGPEAFDPVSRSVTVTNAMGQNVGALGMYVMQGTGGGMPYFAEFEGSANPVRTWFGVPDDRRAAGDFHLLMVSAYTEDEDADNRTVGRVFRAAVDQTMALPAPLTAPAVSSLGATGGNTRLRATYTPQADYGSLWSMGFTQLGNNGVNVTLRTTAAYTAGGPVTLDVPDLTGVTGWNVNWGLKPGFSTRWMFTANGWDASFAPGGSGFAEGAMMRAASKHGTVTP